MKKIAAMAVAFLLAGGSGGFAWSGETAEAIGKPANGCIVGAAALPMAGEGFQVLHPERQRYYAHPGLLRVIRELAREAVDRHWGVLLVGDLSLVHGGPMAYGHGSHQSGLDADLFFLLPPQPLSAEALEHFPMEEVVAAGGMAVDGSRWRPAHAALLEAAAKIPEVERIFVHPAIKRELCRSGQGEWLRKLRPWWGHTEHFHLRLACPPGSPDCVAAAPVPQGEGCGAELDWWFTPAAARPSPAGEKPPMPPRCVEFLAQ